MIDISKFAVSKLASVTNLMTSAKKIPQSDKHISSWLAPLLSLYYTIFNQVLVDEQAVAKMRIWPKTLQNNSINSREMREAPDTCLKFQL